MLFFFYFLFFANSDGNGNVFSDGNSNFKMLQRNQVKLNKLITHFNELKVCHRFKSIYLQLPNSIIFHINTIYLDGFDAYKKCQLRYITVFKNFMQYLKDYHSLLEKIRLNFY